MSYVVPKSKGISLHINSKNSNTDPVELLSNFISIYDPNGLASKFMDIIMAGSDQAQVVQLGAGSFGYVSGYTPHAPNELPSEFAVKVIDKTPTYNVSLLDNEVAALKYLSQNHSTAEYVPKLYAVFDARHEGRNRRFIVMEWIKNGTALSTFVHHMKTTGQYTSEIYNQIKDDLINAVRAIYKAGVIHRDIKPQNIYVVFGTPLKIKIIDFGLAVPSGTTAIVSGSRRYMAPALRNKGEHMYTKDENIHSVWQTLQNIGPLAPIIPENTVVPENPAISENTIMRSRGGKSRRSTRRSTCRSTRRFACRKPSKSSKRLRTSRRRSV